jgi:predicted anti-sigma-YlaC factor YlaD
MIEVVTDYLEGALPSEERERYERHLSYCAGCGAYFEQMRETITLTGTVAREEALPPALREDIVAQFRNWKRRQDD